MTTLIINCSCFPNAVIALNVALCISGFCIISSVVVLYLYHGDQKSLPPQWMMSLFTCGRKGKLTSGHGNVMANWNLNGTNEINSENPNATDNSSAIDKSQLDHIWKELSQKSNHALFWVYISLMVMLFIMVMCMGFLSKNQNDE
jgi:hypothetical protein